MNVLFPHGGHWQMLVHATDDDGQHVIVSRTGDGIRAVVRHVDPDTKLLQYLDIEIVAPPYAIVEMARQHVEKRQESHFWIDVGFGAQAYQEKHGRIPPELKRCPGYEPEDIDAYEREAHESCRHCGRTFAPAVGTKEEFYQARRAAYDEAHPVRPNGVPSRARTPRADERVGVVGIRSGPHEAGVSVYEPGCDLSALADPQEPHLFFYVDPRPLDMSVWVELHDINRKRRDDLAAKEIAKWAAARVERESRQEQDFLRLIQGTPTTTGDTP